MNKIIKYGLLTCLFIESIKSQTHILEKKTRMENNDVSIHMKKLGK